MKRIKNLDIILFLKNKEEELDQKHYDIIMDDCLNFESIDNIMQKKEFLTECRKKLFEVISIELKFDREINKILSILKNL
jgi:hypothetical protein